MARRRWRWSRLLFWLRAIVRNDQLILAVLALVAGGLVGGLIIGFRLLIGVVQTVFFGDETELLVSHLANFSWVHVLLPPVVGGLLVGLFLQFLMPGRRPQGVAEVIEAGAFAKGYMSLRTGVTAAFASALSLGAGASVGREGPAIHLGASFSAWVARRLRLTETLSRTILGCGVAAAVAASFNAPIAGALFAHEVVVGHYALSALAPVVIASVTGMVVSRSYFGDFPAFQLPPHEIVSLWELPSFAVLGIVAGLVGILLIRGIGGVAFISSKLPGPAFLKPMAAGLAVGLIAIVFPQVLGVGYEATDEALRGGYPMMILVGLLVAKLLATMICLGGGFAGGIFSPALVIGAMLGGAFGFVADAILPHAVSGVEAYSVIGMGAVAAAILGAPISTTFIVFEMTSDYALTIAVMVGAVAASVVFRQTGMESFFTWQLGNRGVDLKEGFEASVLRGLQVKDVMSREGEVVTMDIGIQSVRESLQHSPSSLLFVVRENGDFYGTVTLADLSEVAFDHDVDDLINAGDVANVMAPVLTPDEDLSVALKMMADSGIEHMAVVGDRGWPFFVGSVNEVDVLTAYNQALLNARHAERHS